VSDIDRDKPLLDRLLLERRAALNRFLRESLGLNVIDGLFRGISLTDHPGYDQADFAPKILGCYEAEVQAALSLLVGIPYTRIINVGAADGFYATGLARIFPSVPVVAFEMDLTVVPRLISVVEKNNLTNQIEVQGECTVENLNEMCDTEKPLIIMDCEGAEEILIPGMSRENLDKSHYIIEIHEHSTRNMFGIISDLLKDSHRIIRFYQGARNPNIYPLLTMMVESDRWLAVSEFRGNTMSWMLAIPNAEVPESLALPPDTGSTG
jgi:hypothetical protein